MGINIINEITSSYSGSYRSEVHGSTSRIVADSNSNNTTQSLHRRNDVDGSSVKTATATENAVLYEKSSDAQSGTSSKGTYKTDRKQADQIKEAFESQKKQLQDIVDKLISKQGRSFDVANGKNLKNMYAGLTVDAKTRAQAQADIAEDGYWGVTQTSQRIFDFAMALSGGDPEKMEQMRTAFEKGFKQATRAWGDSLPGICQRTYDAVESLFDDYKEKQSGETEEVQA